MLTFEATPCQGAPSIIEKLKVREDMLGSWSTSKKRD